MVKKSKNPKKSQKISKITFFIFIFFIFEKLFVAEEKKCFSLSFPILGGRDSTRALQSSPFQKYKNIKKYQKSLKRKFRKKSFAKKEKKCYPLSFPILGGRDSTRALQSSLFQNPEGGYPERDGEGQTNKGNPRVQFRIPQSE